MAALVRLTAEPGGDRNRYRLAQVMSGGRAEAGRALRVLGRWGAWLSRRPRNSGRRCMSVDLPGSPWLHQPALPPRQAYRDDAAAAAAAGGSNAAKSIFSGFG